MLKQSIQQQKTGFEEKVKTHADTVKQEKRDQKDFMHIQKQQEYLKNTSLKQMIKFQQKEAQEKRNRDLLEKQARTRQQIEEKAQREEMKRIEHEQMVSRMEQEELELIQRLQNTQLLQKAAYEDLENALVNGSQLGDSRPGTSSQKGRGSA